MSLSGGRIAFGVGRGGRQQTICGLIDVADGRWHHVALTRRVADGVMRIYVDGTESAQGVGPAGDISYRDGRPTGVSSDPFLVVGASKADDGRRRPRLLGRARRAAPLLEHPLLVAVRSPDRAVHGRRRDGAAVPLRRRAGRSLPVERRRHVGTRHPRPVPPRRLGDARPALRGRRAVPAAAAEDLAPRRGRPAHRARAGRRLGLADAGASRRHARLTLRAAADAKHPLKREPTPESLRFDSGVVPASTPESNFTPESFVRYGSNAVAVASVPALQNSAFAFQ